MGFLDDLLGIKRVLQGSTLLPQRSAIRFVGCDVADDPTNEQIVVSFAQDTLSNFSTVEFQGPQEEGAVFWTADTAGIGAADLLRVDATGGPSTLDISLIGISSTGLSQRRKVLVNVGSAPLILVHAAEGVSAADAFVLPTNTIVLAPSASVEVLWIAAIGDSPAGWRVLGAGATALS